MSTEEIQEQETDIQENTAQEDVPTVEDTGTKEPATESEADKEETKSEADGEDDLPSREALDAMSDEEFEEYLKSGKIPESKPETSTPSESQAKIISKPKQQETDTASEKATPDIDYKTAYEDLFKPFKANGKEITPRTKEDIVSLMQMGANYTRKMQLLAPMKRTFESLNKADIKEDDLNLLIDVHKGDKEAIKSLLKKLEIDPMDLDLDEIKYSSNKKNIASDSDVEFSDTLLDINDSLPQIQEILNKRWDAKSKEILLRDPKLMRALSEEIQLGRFDKVQKVVEQEKVFGRYKGVSDVEAYIDTVTKLVQEEQRKQQYKENQEKAKQVNPQAQTTPKPTPDKSKAAPTKGRTKSSKSTLTAQDLFSMSEEEFNKLSIKDLV